MDAPAEPYALIPAIDRFKFADGTILSYDTSVLDGLGRIEVDGIPLGGGKEIKAGARVWESGDRKVRYRLYSEADGTQTLNIDYGADFKGRLFLKNFTDNRFGIRLADGDWAPLPTIQAALIGDAPGGWPEDFYNLAGTPVFDGYWIAPLSGRDVAIGSSAADILEGGTQSDLLLGSNGNDVLFGGGGQDLLIGGDDTDLIIGKAKNDSIWRIAA